MIYILAGIVGMCALAIITELLIRAAERTEIMDKLFRLFNLPESEKKPNVIYVDFQKNRKERNA